MTDLFVDDPVPVDGRGLGHGVQVGGVWDGGHVGRGLGLGLGRGEGGACGGRGGGASGLEAQETALVLVLVASQKVLDLRQGEKQEECKKKEEKSGAYSLFKNDFALSIVTAYWISES